MLSLFRVRHTARVIKVSVFSSVICVKTSNYFKLPKTLPIILLP